MNSEYLQDLSKQFKNKVVIITGSTQGSGAETAKLFAHRGAEGITICGRNEEQGLEIKSEIESIGSKCIFVKADLNEAEECQNIVKKTDKTFGKINSLINVAGFTERGTIIIEMRASFRFMMKRRATKRIIFIGSTNSL